MKQRIVFTALLASTISWSTSFAQDRVGFFGGLNFATMQETPGNSGLNYSQRLGLHAGTLYESAWARVLGLRYETSYIKKGVRIQEQDGFLSPRNGTDYETALDFTYVEVALLLKLAAASEIASPYLFAGPTASYLFGVKSSQKEIADEKTETKEEDPTSRYRNFDFGIKLGLGFRFRDFFLEGRYGFAWRDVMRDEHREALHRGWQIVAGITTPI